MGRDDDEPSSPEEWSCFHHHRVAARDCVLTPLVAERLSQLNKQVTACRALCLHDTVHMCASRAGERGWGRELSSESIGCDGRRLQRFIKPLWCDAAAGGRTVGDYRLASGRKCAPCVSVYLHFAHRWWWCNSILLRCRRFADYRAPICLTISDLRSRPFRHQLSDAMTTSLCTDCEHQIIVS